ncbi:hypothetical protein PUN28_004698 [Cardiocondyla obscurior]|uniref:Uncharacterized protein n=1 Tax=Cardiocondyla obscurior TaxID=286306 RepID=A0AAW2GET4_9HYME
MECTKNKFFSLHIFSILTCCIKMKCYLHVDFSTNNKTINKTVVKYLRKDIKRYLSVRQLRLAKTVDNHIDDSRTAYTCHSDKYCGQSENTTSIFSPI